MRILRAADKSVPHDVAVIGFDDDSSAQLLDPLLSTFRQPYEAIGERAVELLLRQIAGGAVPVDRYELPGMLVVRQSTL